MSDSSHIEIGFPLGGVVRRRGFHGQGPATTPDALNVRPDAVPESRMRGGSRPGVAPAFHQVLNASSAIRLVAPVTIQDESGFDFWADNFSATLGNDWNSPATYQDVTVTDGQATSLVPAGAILDALSIDTSSDYTVEVRIVPVDGRHTGTYELWLRMDDSSPDERDEALVCFLTLANDGSYSGSAKVYVAGSATTYSFTGGTDSYAAAGWFSCQVSGNDITVYWRDHKLLDSQTISAPTGARVGFGMDPTISRCAVDRFRVQYIKTGIHRSKRPVLVAGCNGNLYVEDGLGSIARVTGSSQNEKQRITIQNGSGADTFTLTWGGNTTAAIAWDASAATVKSAMVTANLFTTAEISVTGSGPYEVEFEDDLASSDVAEITGSGTGCTVVVETIQEGTTDTTPAIATDTYLSARERLGLLYIADFSDPVAKGTDAVVGGTDTMQVTSATYPTWSSVTSSHAIRLKGTGQNDIQRIQLTRCTEGTYRLFISPKIDDNITTTIAYDASTATVKSAIEGIALIDTGNVTVTGTAGDYYDVEFGSDLANKAVGLLTVVENNTDGQIGITKTQKGGYGTDTSGVVSTVAGANLRVTQLIQTPGGEASFNFTVERSPKVFDPSTGELLNWVAEPGMGNVPIGCSIIGCLADRLILAGDPESPQQWYASRQGDPYDWDYSQEDVGRAVTGNLALAGKLGQPITAIMQSTDNCVIFGCTGSLWIMRGNPAMGGQIENISMKIGVVDRGAWCHGRATLLWFLSDDGLYVMDGNCGASKPESVSREKLPEELIDVNRDLATVLLEYDVEARGIHIFLTYESEAASSTHWFFDVATGSFWPQRFQVDHEPTALAYYRGQDSVETGVILGCRDGMLRRFSKDDNQDDGGNEIESYVDLGPFPLGDGTTDGQVDQLRCAMGKGGDVKWELRTGESPEEAYDATAKASSTWHGVGMNPVNRPRLRGAAFLLRLTGSNRIAWAMERIIAVIRRSGKQRL